LKTPFAKFKALTSAAMPVQESLLRGDVGVDGVERNRPVKQYVDDTFDYEYDMRWWAIAISFLFVIFLRFVVAIATKYLHFQKR
jgi:hypothetical protein